MVIACGIVCLLFGLLGTVGQLISTVNFPLAQRLGLQEADEHTDALYRHAEHNTARWDIVVNWTLPLAGALMVFGHAWAPYVALVAGGIHLDTGGREIVKVWALRAHSVSIGTHKESKMTIGFLVAISVVGAWTIATAALMIARGATG